MPIVVDNPPQTFTDGVAESLSPWGGPGTDWANYNAALSAMFEQVFGIVWDQGSPDDPANYTAGWSTLLDPDACPDEFLPYLGMFVGVFIPIGTDPDLARSLITQEQGFQRGTVAAILAAAMRNLTGTQTVILRERTAENGTKDAYHVVLGFHPSECPDETALINAVEAVKPAGIQFTYVEAIGWTWNEAVNEWQADTITWLASFFTLP